HTSRPLRKPESEPRASARESLPAPATNRPGATPPPAPQARIRAACVSKRIPTRPGDETGHGPSPSGPCTRRPIHATRYPTPDTRYPTPDTRHRAHGSLLLFALSSLLSAGPWLTAHRPRRTQVVLSIRPKRRYHQ